MVKWYASELILRSADLPPALYEACRYLLRDGTDDAGFGASSAVCLFATRLSQCWQNVPWRSVPWTISRR